MSGTSSDNDVAIMALIRGLTIIVSVRASEAAQFVAEITGAPAGRGSDSSTPWSFSLVEESRGDLERQGAQIESSFVPCPGYLVQITLLVWQGPETLPRKGSSVHSLLASGPELSFQDVQAPNRSEQLPLRPVLRGTSGPRLHISKGAAELSILFSRGGITSRFRLSVAFFSFQDGVQGLLRRRWSCFPIS